MIVIKKLTAELQIQLAAKLAYAFFNVLSLQGDVFGVVEPDLHA